MNEENDPLDSLVFTTTRSLTGSGIWFEIATSRFCTDGAVEKIHPTQSTAIKKRQSNHRPKSFFDFLSIFIPATRFSRFQDVGLT